MESPLSAETLVDYDPLTRTETHIDVDHEAGIMTVASFQDATDIVEANKLLYNSVDAKAPYGEKFNRMAQIPTNIWFDLVRRGIANDETALRKWLDDRDNLLFRTRPGKLSR